MSIKLDLTIDISTKIVRLLAEQGVTVEEAVRALDQAKEDLMRARLQSGAEVTIARVV